MFGVQDKYSHKNGRTSFEKKDTSRRSLGELVSEVKEIQVNEWTFSVFLFAMSLTIVAVKLAVIYGSLLPTKTDLVKIPNQSLLNELTPAIYNDYLLNTTREYKETVIEVLGKFGWFIKAAASGLSLMGFTWFIVYKDSRIPGVNPPSPFSPSKRKFHDESRIQMNYLIGVLNGVLIFIYMCL